MKLNLVTTINSLSELERIVHSDHFNKDKIQIILSPKELARISSNTQEEILEMLAMSRKHGLFVTLLWDALFTEKRFIEACAYFSALPLHDFNSVRLQDPGAVHFVKTNYSWLPIELVLENSNHNLLALKKWQDYLGPQCSRLVLSNQLSKEMLKVYAGALNAPLEVLVLGRVLLFYGPRKLLSPFMAQEKMEEIRASASSEESPHTGFPVIENSHGTFMFNVKDLYLLDLIDELSDLGLTHARVDLRFDGLSDQIDSILGLFSGKIKEEDLLIKKNHVRPMIKGFYNINKTDVLFSKLKNNRIARHDQNYVGEIVDVEKGEQLALKVLAEKFICLNDQSLRLVTPEGKEKILTLNNVRTSLGENVQSAHKYDIVMLPFLNGVTVKTQVYLNSKT